MRFATPEERRRAAPAWVLKSDGREVCVFSDVVLRFVLRCPVSVRQYVSRKNGECSPAPATGKLPELKNRPRGSLELASFRCGAFVEFNGLVKALRYLFQIFPEPLPRSGEVANLLPASPSSSPVNSAS